MGNSAIDNLGKAVEVYNFPGLRLKQKGKMDTYRNVDPRLRELIESPIQSMCPSPSSLTEGVAVYVQVSSRLIIQFKFRDSTRPMNAVSIVEFGTIDQL